jgi:hypothetical protein
VFQFSPEAKTPEHLKGDDSTMTEMTSIKRLKTTAIMVTSLITEKIHEEDLLHLSFSVKDFVDPPVFSLNSITGKFCRIPTLSCENL